MELNLNALRGISVNKFIDIHMLFRSVKVKTTDTSLLSVSRNTICLNGFLFQFFEFNVTIRFLK